MSAQQPTSPPPSSGCCGRKPSGQRKPPSIGRRIINFAEALAKFGSNPGLVDDETFDARITACTECEPPDGYRNGRVCEHPDCGCLLVAKARVRSQDCPIGRWSLIPVSPLVGETPAK